MSVLYHASPQTKLKLIKPRKTLSHNKYIGDFVFATSDIKLATMYLATKGNATLMNSEGETPYIVICSNKKDYLANDKGGAIYTVPDKSFKKTPQEELEESELVSEFVIKPLRETIYKSSIGAMEAMGINIYFVNQNTFNKLIKSKNKEKILLSLRPHGGS